MNDRNVSRKTLTGYNNTAGYGKNFKDNKSYNGRNPGPGSLIQAPKKKVVRPIQLSSLKSESDTTQTTSAGWAKKDDRNGVGKTGVEKAGGSSTPTKPWSSQRGVPGLNQPEPAKREFTELGTRTGSNRNATRDGAELNSQQRSEPKKQNPMLPKYLKPPEEQNKGATDVVREQRNGTRAGNENSEVRGNGSSHHEKIHDRSRPIVEVVEEKKEIHTDTNLFMDDWMDDKMMESWADDKPVNWNEKIDFSDDDVSNSTSQKPKPEPEHNTRDYDNRYDNHRYDHCSDRRSYNHRNYDTKYDSRDTREYERKSTYHHEPPRVSGGFYDDHRRGYYERDLKSRKDYESDRSDLFRPHNRLLDKHHSNNHSQSANNYGMIESNQDKHEPVQPEVQPQQDDSSESTIDMIIEDELIQEMPKRKIVRKSEQVSLRDFTNEEKGEEVDEIEVKNDEKEKQAKPRGWKTDEKEKKTEKKKKNERNDQTKGHKTGRLPTADGSRQSRLDKENAEKEINNKNVWAERLNKKSKTEENDERSHVFVPCEEDKKRTLGETAPKSTKNSRENFEGPDCTRNQIGPRYQHENQPRHGAHHDDSKKVEKGRRNRGSNRDDSKRSDVVARDNDRYRNDRHAERPINSRDEHSRNDKSRRDKRKPKHDERLVEVDERSSDKGHHDTDRLQTPHPASGATADSPKPNHTEYVEAEPPRTNIWAERIKQQQNQKCDDPRKFRENSQISNNPHNTRRERPSSKSKRPQRDRNSRQSHEQASDYENRDMDGSKGNLAKFRENERRKNEKRDYSGSNENIQKKKSQKGKGFNQRLNRLESKDEDDGPREKKPRRREEESKTKKKESGSSAEDVTRSHFGRSSARKLSERAGKRRNERPRRHERFKNAYEFPKPTDDVKDASVPNVEAIRGGLSFRGLMKQRAGATCSMRVRADRPHSSDQSTTLVDDLPEEEAEEEDDNIEMAEECSETAQLEEQPTIQLVQPMPNPPTSTVNTTTSLSSSDMLNVNAGEFQSQKTFSPARTQAKGHFPEPEVTGISFIALPSPNQALNSPAGNRPGIYGDTTSNSPQLVRMEDQPNSPIHLEESTLKKMELSRKAWDNAPVRSGVFNGFQATPGQQQPQVASKPPKEQDQAVNQSQASNVQSVVQSQTSFDSAQPISSEPVNSNWVQQGVPNSAAAEWSKNTGASSVDSTSSVITGATWGKTNPQTDQWKKEQIPLQQQAINEVNQLQQGLTPNPSLNPQLNQPQINQMSFSRQNQYPADGLNNMSITNQLNAHLLNSASGYAAASTQQSNSALQYSNFNNQNPFYNNQQQVYPSTQLIQPNQLNNAIDFGGQQNLYSNQLGSSSFNSNMYGSDQRQSDFGFNSASNMMYPFDNTMLANLQRQTQSNNVPNLFPYQSNITPNAFNLGMNQTQRPDLTANLRANIGNPHHMQSSNMFGKSPSPSPASITQKLMNHNFSSDFAFNASTNMPSFRLKPNQNRSNSVTPPHHQRTNKRNEFSTFNMNGRGFDSTFESQKSYMGGAGNEFDPKMNQYQFMNSRNPTNQPPVANQFDQTNYFAKQQNTFGQNPFVVSNGGFISQANGRNSRNGSIPNNVGVPSVTSRNGGVIGNFGHDKKFGSVGTKLDQKSGISNERGLKNSKKSMNKDFLPSQKEKADSQQALINKVSELTNKFSSTVTLEKTSCDSTPTSSNVGPENGAQADNIVLSVDDRKRLTLADTAPKGGIRRIISDRN